MRLMLLVSVCVIIALAACNDNGPTKVIKMSSLADATAKPAKEPVSSKLPPEGTTLMMQLVDKYYDLKNALVATNAAQADSAAMQLATIAGIFNRFAETDTANGKKLKPYADTILSQSRLLPAIKDESCEKQRITFDHISSALYGAIKAAGVKNAGIYHQFCPMAFNERGAYWLSKESEIKNPYFGKKMLECGEVTDSL